MENNLNINVFCVSNKRKLACKILGPKIKMFGWKQTGLASKLGMTTLGCNPAFLGIVDTMHVKNTP